MQLVQPQPRVLLLPDVERRLADPVLAADVANLGAPSAWRNASRICSSA